MARLTFQISMSLDGFIAGPNPTQDEPLGVGGEQLHEWGTKLAAWRGPHGLEGGEVNESSAIMEESRENVGAVVMGRNMFGGGPGPWGEDPWSGWWGDDPPFHTPVFVLTHHPREPLTLKGGTSFHFVTDGISPALEQAREAAGDRDVAVAGGADVAQQYLTAGLIDEMLLNVVPVLLHDGTRLFDNVKNAAIALEPKRAVATPDVTHLFYAVTS